MKKCQIKVLYVTFITLLILQITPYCRATSGSAGKNVFSETKLASLPKNLIQTIPLGKDLGLAYVNNNDKQCISFNGKEGPGFDVIALDSLVFNVDSGRLLYVAEAENAGQLLVVNNGKAGKEYSGIGDGTLVMSPDSNRIAYAAKKNNQWMNRKI